MMFTKFFLVACFITLNLSQLSRAKCNRQEYLDCHNKIRAEVGVEPLHWSETLEKYAQDYADQRSGECAMQHSGGPYGENLAMGTNADVEAVQWWASEKADYDYESNTCRSVSPGCLHYTQIVSRKTVQVGCGISNCNDGSLYVVCSYDPIGNCVGEKPY